MGCTVSVPHTTAEKRRAERTSHSRSVSPGLRTPPNGRRFVVTASRGNMHPDDDDDVNTARAHSSATSSRGRSPSTGGCGSGHLHSVGPEDPVPIHFMSAATRRESAKVVAVASLHDGNLAAADRLPHAASVEKLGVPLLSERSPRIDALDSSFLVGGPLSRRFDSYSRGGEAQLQPNQSLQPSFSPLRTPISDCFGSSLATTAAANNSVTSSMVSEKTQSSRLSSLANNAAAAGTSIMSLPSMLRGAPATLRQHTASDEPNMASASSGGFLTPLGQAASPRWDSIDAGNASPLQLNSAGAVSRPHVVPVPASTGGSSGSCRLAADAAQAGLPTMFVLTSAPHDEPFGQLITVVDDDDDEDDQ